MRAHVINGTARKFKDKYLSKIRPQIVAGKNKRENQLLNANEQLKYQKKLQKELSTYQDGSLSITQ